MTTTVAPSSNITNDTTTTGPNISQTYDVGYTPCQVPLSHVPDNVLPALWHVVYWSSQFLTW